MLKLLALFAVTSGLLAGCALVPSDPAPPPISLSIGPQGALIAALPACNESEILSASIETVPADTDGQIVWSAEETLGRPTSTVELSAEGFARESGDYRPYLNADVDLVVTVDVTDRLFVGEWLSGVDHETGLAYDGDQIVEEGDLADPSLCD